MVGPHRSATPQHKHGTANPDAGEVWWRVQQAPLPAGGQERERERGAELTNFLHSTVVDDGQIMRSAGPVDPLWGLNVPFFFFFFFFFFKKNLWMRSELPGQKWWVFCFLRMPVRCCSPVAPDVRWQPGRLKLGATPPHHFLIPRGRFSSCQDGRTGAEFGFYREFLLFFGV